MNTNSNVYTVVYTALVVVVVAAILSFTAMKLGPLQNANAKCVYRSGLIGLGQPAWYFEAWKHTDEDDPEE